MSGSLEKDQMVGLNAHGHCQLLFTGRAKQAGRAGKVIIMIRPMPGIELARPIHSTAVSRYIDGCVTMGNADATPRPAAATTRNCFQRRRSS